MEAGRLRAGYMSDAAGQRWRCSGGGATEACTSLFPGPERIIDRYADVMALPLRICRHAGHAERPKIARRRRLFRCLS